MRVLAGPEKKSRLISEKEKAITAYHEMGHALVGHFLPNTDPVHKISIVSRGAGARLHDLAADRRQVPHHEDRAHRQPRHDARRSRRRGGRVRRDHHRGGERHREGDQHRQADDHALRHERKARAARRWATTRPMPFLGREFAAGADYSEEIARQIDDEIRRIIEEAHERAKDLLRRAPRAARRASPRSSSSARPSSASSSRPCSRACPRKRSSASATPRRRPGARRSRASADKKERVPQPQVVAPTPVNRPPTPRPPEASPAGRARRGPRRRSSRASASSSRASAKTRSAPGLVETPRRVAEMYDDIFSGIDGDDPAELLVAMPGDHHHEMVLIKDIDFYSICEHHLLPFHGTAARRLHPRASTGTSPGLSKLARVVRLVAARPQLQERITSEVADAIDAGARAARRAGAHRGRAPLHVDARRAHPGGQDRHQRRARHHPDRTPPRGPRSSRSSTPAEAPPRDRPPPTGHRPRHSPASWGSST